MLITFKSKAASEILMYQEHAQRILDMWRKPAERGVLTVPELPRAIAVLQAAVEESRQHPVSDEVRRDVDLHQDEEDHEHGPLEPVSFATRAYPLLEMLQAAQRNAHEVMWGV